MRQFVLVAACVLAAASTCGADALAPGTAFPAGSLADDTAALPGQAPQ